VERPLERGDMKPSSGPFGGPTSMAGAHQCAPAVASWLCVAAFRRLCLCRGLLAEGAIVPFCLALLLPGTHPVRCLVGKAGQD